MTTIATRKPRNSDNPRWDCPNCATTNHSKRGSNHGLCHDCGCAYEFRPAVTKTNTKRKDTKEPGRPIPTNTLSTLHTHAQHEGGPGGTSAAGRN